MRNTRAVLAAVVFVAILLVATEAMADTFGAGGNQFSLAFVPISGATNPSSGYGIVNHDYRMGTFDITNDQWNKFTASLSVPVTGSDGGYTYSSYFTGANVPVNAVSWFEAAQFVNWLNTSTNHQVAYKFTGTQGTGSYTLATWSAGEAANNGTNLYRNKDAFYYLPTEDEWVKAAYWNGASLQTYATKPGDTLYQGNGSNGGWNYYNNGFATNPYGPWAVGSGSQELNGTYDMMGNIWHWEESPYISGDYGTASIRGLRGGSYSSAGSTLASSSRFNYFTPASEGGNVGFRVASEVPEPHAGDANNDGAVDVVDLGVLAKYYSTAAGATWDMGDFSGDGAVNVVDLGVLAKNYGWTGAPAGAAPEPATLSLLALGGLAMLRRRNH